MGRHWHDRDLERIAELAEALQAEMSGFPKSGTAFALSADLQAAMVGTAQTTASGAYTDLATVGPSVTISIAASGLAIITMSAFANDTNAADFGLMSFAASGANTIAAADAQAAQAPAGTNGGSFTGMYIYAGGTALSPGSTTFTAKYKAGGGAGTANFANRCLQVITF